MAIFKGVYKNSFILKGGKNVERCANFEAKCAPVKHIRICVLKGDYKKNVKWLYSARPGMCSNLEDFSPSHEKKRARKNMIRGQKWFDNMKLTPKRKIYVFSKNLHVFHKEACVKSR